MFSQNLNQIPVPEMTSSEKSELANLSQQCQSLSEQSYQIQQKFRRRLPDLCPPEQNAKLNNKLKNWWQLDFEALQKEIKKAFKTRIPLAERNDWQDYFEAEQAKIRQLDQQLKQQESQLNQSVYQLFQLTPEEISLLQTSL